MLADKKVVAIHQPESYPWLGFFNKMMLSDCYVLLDNVDFRKNYFQNRNQFLSNSGPLYLSIPVAKSESKILKDVPIQNEQNWQHKQKKTIELNYSKHPFFKTHFPEIVRILDSRHERLIDLNIAVINYVREFLGISTEIHRASELSGLAGSKTDLLVSICKAMGASVYLSGRDGRNYLELEKFQLERIEVVYQKFLHPAYHQMNSRGDFVPYMSVFDLLFNHSQDEAKEIIYNGGRYKCLDLQ